MRPAPNQPATRGQRLRLRDGQIVLIRRVRPEDEPVIASLLEGMSLRSRRLRFFTAGSDLHMCAHEASEPRSDRVGLVAIDASGRAVGHAVYARLPGHRRAEVAVAVADELHGKGLGTILVARLALLAEHAGITRFLAVVLPENHAMLDVLRDGFDATVSRDGPLDTVELETGSWRHAARRFAQERTATARSPAQKEPSR